MGSLDTWGGYVNWTNVLVRDPRLVTPVRHLWASYQQHCHEWGLPTVEARKFVEWLVDEEGTRLDTVNASDGTRRVIHGVAPKKMSELRRVA